MSAPPPGGSPPPQQPYPQQPYPQQYPPGQPYPQQPYYGQPQAPPPKKSNLALIIVVVVVIVVVALALVAWWAMTVLLAPVQTATQVTVTGVSWTVNYPGSTQYFGASPLTSCTSCPFTHTITTQMQYILTLHNSDTVAHTVSDITVDYPFTKMSMSPDPSSAAVTVPAGGSTSFTLMMMYSSLGGSTTLTGSITTT